MECNCIFNLDYYSYRVEHPWDPHPVRSVVPVAYQVIFEPGILGRFCEFESPPSFHTRISSYV